MNITEAKQQISQAKSQIIEQRQRAEQTKRQLEEARTKLPTITSQKALRTGDYSGLNGRTKRLQIQRAKEEIKSRLSGIKEYETQLGQYEQGVLQTEENIKKVEQAKQEQAQLQSDYEIARKIATSGGSSQLLSNDRQKEFYRQIKDGIFSQQQFVEQSKAIREATGLSNYEFSKLSSGDLSSLSPPSLEKLEKVGVIKIDTSRIQDRKETAKISEFNALVGTSSQSLFFNGGGMLPLVSASAVEPKKVSISASVGGGIPSEKKSVLDRAVDLFTKKTYTIPQYTNITTPSGTYVSAYPTGTGATAQIFPLSMEQQKKMEEVGAKSTAIISAPIKVLSGDYEWQKRLEYAPVSKEKSWEQFLKEREQQKKQEYESLEYERETSYGELFKKGMLPSIVRKGFYELGGGATTLGETITQKKVPQQYKPLVSEQLGYFAMGTFFAPAFSTGAVARQKTIQKEMTKGRFDELTEYYSGIQADIEKGVLNKVTAEGQTEYLMKIYKKLETPEQKENFKELVRYMYESGIYKGIPVEVISAEQTTKQISILGNVPQMRGSGSLTGLSTEKGEIFPTVSAQQKIQIEKTNQVDWIGTSQKTPPKLKGFSQLKMEQKLKPKTKQEQQEAQIEMLKQVPKQEESQISRSALRSMLGLKTTQAQKSESLLKQKQTTKQKTTRGIKQKQEPPKKFKFPILFGGEKKKKKSEEELFEIFSRRFGKTFKIGSAVSVIEAKGILQKYIFGGLARSGAIKTKEGKFLDIDLGSSFRRAKSSKLKGFVVQKNPLQFKTETREIQFFRKKKSKKKSLFDF